MIRYKILFWIRKSGNSSARVPINCRITVKNGGRHEFRVGKSISPLKWDQKAQKAKGSSQDAVDLNDRLQEIKNDIKLIVDNAKTAKEFISARSIVLKYNKDPESIPTFLSLYDKIILNDSKNKDYSEDTKRALSATRSLYKNFFLWAYKSEDVLATNINDAFWRDFQDYCLIEKEYNNNYVLKTVSRISQVIKYCIRKGYASVEPYESLTVKPNKSTHKFLEYEEVLIIEGKDFSVFPYHADLANTFNILEIPYTAQGNFIYLDKHALETINLVRDLLMAQIKCGAAYEDLRLLSEENILLDPSRKKILQYSRAKTGEVARQPLLEDMEALINKYAHTSHRKVTGRLFPVPSNKHYNKILKRIQLICGIKKNLTTHVGRHTFGTLKSEEGWDQADIAAMMGHSNVRSTAIYSRVTNRRLLQKQTEIEEKRMVATV
jgi:integrase